MLFEDEEPLIDERFLPDKSSMISCGWKASSGFIRVKEEDISSSMVISRHLFGFLRRVHIGCKLEEI